MYYDLHLHSCLSPCAEDEMTPNNICNMAMLKGLDLIALTDHNSTKQLPAFAKVADSLGLSVLYGCELESAEEVHVLGLFNQLEKALRFQEWIDEKLPFIQNDENYFGKQEICNEKDEVIEKLQGLLIVSLNASLEACVQAIHDYGGKVILAHVLDRQNSITHQLGFIPQDLAYDGIEVKKEEEIERVLKMHPWIQKDSTHWFIDSDAHRLVDMSEKEHAMEDSVYQMLWGDTT
ncbi:MAG: PHP domain-containing protein [Solobacterium sp.]|nr:PHP domain-containing protein [Solobacterium sp.]